ncbi:MAG TPA: SUF system Fe-S cluster assembly protein [Fimbriimonadaceae bacterium]|nr:SUF system Fe-S cluster assembly protein [Fimbriimonadaceae bacterium]
MEKKTLNPIEKSLVKNEIIEALREVYDPEIPVNIYDLGLIYEIELDDEGNAHVLMTLTSPACPVAETLPGEVEVAVESVSGVNRARVELTWDPPFTIERMSEDIRLMLGLM